jgi:hypothetical protein
VGLGPIVVVVAFAGTILDAVAALANPDGCVMRGWIISGSAAEGAGVARAANPYPPDHELALARVLRVVDLITARPDIRDDEVVSALVGDGVGQVDARLLVQLVPCAMSYPMLRRLGVTSFPSFYVVRARSGRVVHLPLAGEHYFTAALAWAEGLFALAPADRPLSVEAWNAVAGRSAEMDCVNNMLASHGPEALRGAAVSPTVLGGITAEEIAASHQERRQSRPWWRFW